MEKSYALVTGASSGLGREFARQLSKKGYSIVAVARREDRLKELGKDIMTDYRYYTCDLTDFDEAEKVLEKIFDENRIEVVINNAGFGLCGEFEKLKIEDEFRMIDTNIKALQMILKASIIYFRDCRIKGSILNVSSSASLFPAGPYMATYYASKAYVTSLVSAVHYENRDIYIGALCPGPVDTEFNKVANVRFALKGITPEYCVRYALKKMDRKKEIIIPEFKLKAACFFSKIMPRKFTVGIVSKQQRRKIYE